MFCIKCGKEIADASKFCKFCGGSQEAEISLESAQPAATVQPPQQPIESAQPPQQPAQPPQQPAATSTASSIPVQPTPVYATPTQGAAPSRGKNKKLLIIIAAILVVIVLALLILPSLLGSGNYIKQEDFPHVYGDTLYLPNGDTEEFPNCEIMTTGFSSRSGNFVLETYNEYDGTKTLYYFSKSGKKTIVEFDDFDDYFGVLALSNNGKAVLYNTYEDGDDTLYLYSGGKSKEIASGEVNVAAVSPDGKTVLYTDEDYDTYLWKGGKAKEVDSDIFPVGLSNGGKLIYYLDEEDELYVRNGKNDTKLGTDVDGGIFTIDNSSILFYNNDGKLYISKNGKKAVSIKGDSSGSILFPNNESSYFGTGDFYGIPIKDYENTFYLSDSKLYRINGKYESVQVAKGVDSVGLCKDGKTLFFVESDTLYKINGNGSSPKKKEIADDVSNIAPLGDNNSIYFTDEDNELYYYNGGKAKEIDGAEANYISYFKKTDSVYYIDDEELYSSKNGSKGKLVEGMDSDEIDYIYSYGSFLMVQTLDGFYLTTDGKNFIELDY